MRQQENQSKDAMLDEYLTWQKKNMSDQLNQMASLQDNIIMTMVNLIETRDGTSGGHVKRACVYISYLLKKMLYTNTYPESITKESVALIIKAAPLYDIGKLAISDLILRKPGHLSDEEFELVKTHTTIGSEMIQKNLGGIVSTIFLHLAASMAACHHERWDGTGYPSGLKGAAIPICARVTAIADVFDALVSKTYYSGQRNFQEAVRIMEESEGQFDPVLLALFMEDKAELQRIMDSNSHDITRYLIPEDGLLNCGNHKEYYLFLLDLYLEELEEKEKLMLEAMDQKQYGLMNIYAHSLKDTSRDAGAQLAATLAECMLFAAQEKNDYALQKYRKRIEECICKTREEVREYLLAEREKA